MTWQFGIKACVWRDQVGIVIGLFGYFWYHVKSYLRFVFSILPLYVTERFTFPIRESAHNEFSSECLWVLVIPLKGKPRPLSLACVFRNLSIYNVFLVLVTKVNSYWKKVSISWLMRIQFNIQFSNSEHSNFVAIIFCNNAMNGKHWLSW